MENARLLTQRVDIGVCKKCEDTFFKEDNDSCDEPVKAMRNKCALLINQNTHYAFGLHVHLQKQHLKFMKNIHYSDKNNKMETWDKVYVNSGQILSESKIDNSTIELNDLTVMKVPKFNDNQSIPKCAHLW